MLKVLAEDYIVNPGLFMSCADLKHNFDTDNEKIVSVLVTLEKDNIVKIYRNNGVIELAKATYSGLRKANPIEYYRWFPSRVSEDELF